MIDRSWFGVVRVVSAAAAGAVMLGACASDGGAPNLAPTVPAAVVEISESPASTVEVPAGQSGGAEVPSTQPAAELPVIADLPGELPATVEPSPDDSE